MNLQNRVTPFGDIVAISQRGLFTGNRGIIHDPSTRTLLRKRWVSKTWLVCSCEFQGRRRSVMTTRSWTELFFLDEAVALAAGHRPCFLCRREAAERFRSSWTAATGAGSPSAAQIDTILHAERLDHGRRRHFSFDDPVQSLPDGAMVSVGGSAFLVLASRSHQWTNAGYAAPVDIGTAELLLTPPSTVAALRAGYQPVLHPTADPCVEEHHHG